MLCFFVEEVDEAVHADLRAGKGLQRKTCMQICMQPSRVARSVAVVVEVVEEAVHADVRAGKGRFAEKDTHAELHAAVEGGTECCGLCRGDRGGSACRLACR